LAENRGVYEMMWKMW